MPKIPTFTATGRPTTEVGSVRSNIQIPLTQNFFWNTRWSKFNTRWT